MILVTIQYSHTVRNDSGVKTVEFANAMDAYKCVQEMYVDGFNAGIVWSWELEARRDMYGDRE